jgi:hypothetical protein
MSKEIDTSSLDDFFDSLPEEKKEPVKAEEPKKPRVSISDNVCISCEG